MVSHIGGTAIVEQGSHSSLVILLGHHPLVRRAAVFRPIPRAFCTFGHGSLVRLRRASRRCPLHFDLFVVAAADCNGHRGRGVNTGSSAAAFGLRCQPPLVICRDYRLFDGQDPLLKLCLQRNVVLWCPQRRGGKYDDLK